MWDYYTGEKRSAEQMRAAVKHELSQFVPGIFGPKAQNDIKRYFEDAQTVRALVRDQEEFVRVRAGYDNNTKMTLIAKSENRRTSVEITHKRFRNENRPSFGFRWWGKRESDTLDSFEFSLVESGASFFFMEGQVRISFNGGEKEKAIKVPFMKDGFDDATIQKLKDFQKDKEVGFLNLRNGGPNLKIDFRITDARGDNNFNIEVPKSVQVASSWKIEPLLFQVPLSVRPR